MATWQRTRYALWHHDQSCTKTKLTLLYFIYLTQQKSREINQRASTPIKTLTTYDLPIQLKKGSFLHWLEQPSPFIEFISSHSSPLELKQQEVLGKNIQTGCPGIKYFSENALLHISMHAFLGCEGVFMLPLYASIPTVLCPKFVHQWWRGLTLTPARDGLDLVGVRNMWQQIPAQRESKITVSAPIWSLFQASKECLIKNHIQEGIKK